MSGAAVTVLMATHNGQRTLPQVLNAYLCLDAVPGGYHLVVADNASTDETPRILARYADRLPLRVVPAPDRGKNKALNRALAFREGALVVLTDDDAVPKADWLVQLQRTAVAQPQHAVFGGAIEPVWPGACPEWIPRLVNMGATFAVTPAGARSGPVPAAQVWGPNMAIRREAFDAGHRFDETIGPSAGQYVMGSEVEFTCRLEKAGYRAWFCAEAEVGHLIRENQLDPQWIIQRAFRLGRHMCHQERDQIAPGTALWRGAPRWRYGQFVREKLRSLWGHARRDFDTAFLADWELSFLRGYLSEAARLHKERA
jgi:glycosyltransferase involved in cell wall biosynthesis